MMAIATELALIGFIGWRREKHDAAKLDASGTQSVQARVARIKIKTKAQPKGFSTITQKLSKRVVSPQSADSVDWVDQARLGAVMTDTVALDPARSRVRSQSLPR